MIKRIVIIGALTGTGQLFSIFILKILSERIRPEYLSEIAQVDTLFQFILSFIALGLQSVGIRNLALSKNWHIEYQRIQSARVSLGILLMFLGLFIFKDFVYIMFLISPLFALSGDYALYALNRPIIGSVIALIRIIIPFTTLWFSASYMPENISYLFIVSFLITYLITNVLVAKSLDVQIIYKPVWNHLKLYIESLHVGFALLALFFLGTGLLLVVPYFYPSAIVATVFIGIKFYMIFKGVIRIIHQAFIKGMMDHKICLKIDQISILLGLMLFISISIFPSSFIQLFFSSVFLKDQFFFVLLGLAALIFSFFFSSATSAMLQKKDVVFAVYSVLAGLITIISIIIASYFYPEAESIGWALCLGEMVLLIGLYNALNLKYNLFKARIYFLLKQLPLVLVPICIRVLFVDDLIWFLISISLFGIGCLVVNYNNFKQLS